MDESEKQKKIHKISLKLICCGTFLTPISISSGNNDRDTFIRQNQERIITVTTRHAIHGYSIRHRQRIQTVENKKHLAFHSFREKKKIFFLFRLEFLWLLCFALTNRSMCSSYESLFEYLMAETKAVHSNQSLISDGFCLFFILFYEQLK